MIVYVKQGIQRVEIYVKDVEQEITKLQQGMGHVHNVQQNPQQKELYPLP